VIGDPRRVPGTIGDPYRPPGPEGGTVRLVILAAALFVAVPAAALGATDATASAAATDTTVARSPKAPPPPKLPSDFRGKGRYVVPDLGIDVPFTWEGNDGEAQMIAGGPDEPIYFTNIISGGVLYTLTYTWPGLARRPCSRIGPFTLSDLNAFFEHSRYAGPEILEGPPRRRVHHFRAGVVWEAPPEVVPPDVVTPVGGSPDTDGGVTLRIPLMLGDFYVDRKNPEVFWQVLHFGLQNLYDPDLDEWIVMDSFKPGRAGAVTLPEECASAPAS
jgi:hypothetical protein